MMGIKQRKFHPLPEVSLEDLVQADHFYRHLDRSLDLCFVRDLVKACYSQIGRPSIAPRLRMALSAWFLSSKQQIGLSTARCVIRANPESKI